MGIIGRSSSREIYCGGGWHWRMIFWGQYIVSPRAQTTQTIPPREDRLEMSFFSALILKPGHKVEFEMTMNMQSLKGARRGKGKSYQLFPHNNFTTCKVHSVMIVGEGLNLRLKV